MSVCEDTRKACLKCTIAVDIVPGGKFLVFSRRAHTYFCLASCISFHLLVVMHAFKMRFRGAAEIHVRRSVLTVHMPAGVSGCRCEQNCALV